MDRIRDIGVGDEKGGAVDFRHLAAFQKVYEEKHYANAGHDTFTTRKSIVRMMGNLESHFDCALFSEGLRGELVPSPFADRLYNDLRFLISARQRMKDHIANIHENGRILHVGCSPAIFRTREFRNIFRKLQSTTGIRACFVPVDYSEATKMLVSGHCDLYVGCRPGTGSRFVTMEAGSITFQVYRRASRDAKDGGKTGHDDVTQVVSLDGKAPLVTGARGGKSGRHIVEDSGWLYWLDHPGECPLGTVICGPDIQMDPEYWQPADDYEVAVVEQKLHVSFLRQHPYEFLPALAEKIQSRVPAK